MPMTEITPSQAAIILAVAHTEPEMSAAVAAHEKASPAVVVAAALVDAVRQGDIRGPQARLIERAHEVALTYAPVPSIRGADSGDPIADSAAQFMALADQRPEPARFQRRLDLGAPEDDTPGVNLTRLREIAACEFPEGPR